MGSLRLWLESAGSETKNLPFNVFMCLVPFAILPYCRIVRLVLFRYISCYFTACLVSFQVSKAVYSVMETANTVCGLWTENT